LNWITDAKIPIGSWAKSFVDWLTSNGEWFFNQLAFLLSHVINGLLFVLQTPHPLIVLVAITALAWWLRRSAGVAAFTFFGLLLIINQGYWKETTQTPPPSSACSSEFRSASPVLAAHGSIPSCVRFWI
jgi:glycine betaine/proline transport system permease protein